MNLQHLYYFQEVAITQNYARAAERLHTTQPNLSYAIAMLEKELGGIHLFEKQGRNIYLSQNGKMFYEYVNLALNKLDEGKQAMLDQVGINTNTIILSFIYTLGSYFLPTMLKRFKEIPGCEDTTFFLQHSNTENILKLLKEKALDFGFCSYVSGETDIEFIPVLKQNLVVITPLGHPLASQESLDLVDVAKYPLISFSSQCALRQYIESLFLKVGALPKVAVETESDSAVASLVADNFGISVVPEIKLLEHYDIAVRPISNPQYESYIYLAHLKARRLSAVEKLFFNYVTSEIFDIF